MKEREQIRKTEIWKTHLDSYRLQAKKKSKKRHTQERKIEAEKKSNACKLTESTRLLRSLVEFIWFY